MARTTRWSRTRRIRRAWRRLTLGDTGAVSLNGVAMGPAMLVLA